MPFIIMQILTKMSGFFLKFKKTPFSIRESATIPPVLTLFTVIVYIIHKQILIACLQRQLVACITIRPVTEKDHGNFKIQMR